MPENIDREGVRRLMAGGATVVEVLEKSQYRKAHLPGAVHIPGWELTEERASALDKQRATIVYCFDTL